MFKVFRKELDWGGTPLVLETGVLDLLLNTYFPLSANLRKDILFNKNSVRIENKH